MSCHPAIAAQAMQADVVTGDNRYLLLRSEIKVPIMPMAPKITITNPIG
jgi:hypothetical protein